MSEILITGGAGYIGGSVALMLAKMNHKVIIIDNLSNSDSNTIFNIINKSKNITFYKSDICDVFTLNKIFSKHDINYVFHFAGLKSVSDSLKNPNLYLNNNVYKSKIFINFCLDRKISKFIFSSSATVYGDPIYFPIDEKHPINPKNPYAISKYLIEDYLKALSRNYLSTQFTILRYFNPIGSLVDYDHGENISDKAENLFPKIILSIKNKKDFIINGNQYDTEDGTAIRDFIHIEDLAHGHISCLNYESNLNLNNFNLGTGTGTTILNLINKFSELTGSKINFNFGPDRHSDIGVSYSSALKANHILKWYAKKTINEMILDSWNFYSKNFL